MNAVHAVNGVLDRPGAEEYREHVRPLGGVQRPDLLCQPFLGLCERAARGPELSLGRGALALEPVETRLDGGERRLGARQLRLEREELESRLLFRRLELGAARAQRRRVVRMARRRYEKHAGDREGRGWSFPLHCGLTVSEGSGRCEHRNGVLQQFCGGCRLQVSADAARLPRQ